MKKLLSFFCIMTMVFALAACAGQIDTTNGSSPEPSSQTTDTQESSQTNDGQHASEEENSEETISTESTEDTTILVAYFSATGNTKKVAEYAADAMGAALYQIVPEEPYTSEDLDYGNDNSRTSAEMNDDSARPAISGNVENMEQYETIFLGYPIWWGQAPRIIDTFVEAYDFSDKTIIPFCTSGSSGIGSSSDRLQELASKDAVWLDGNRFSASSTREDVVTWINGLGLDITAH